MSGIREEKWSVKKVNGQWSMVKVQAIGCGYQGDSIQSICLVVLCSIGTSGAHGCSTKRCAGTRFLNLFTFYPPDVPMEQKRDN